jgi:hypothetical protein
MCCRVIRIKVTKLEVLSSRGIKEGHQAYGRSAFWAIQFLTQNVLKSQRQELTLGDVVRRIREEYFGQIIVYVFQQALEKKPLFDILNQLKLSA